MSERTETAVPTAERLEPWQGGVVAGLLGGLGMGLFMSVLTTSVVEVAIPALWGMEGGAIGWLIHMVNSAVFGVVFALLATQWPVGTLERSLGAGLAFGVVLWVVAAGLVMPVWLGAVGFATPPPVPNLTLNGFLAHAIFGVILGVAYVRLLGAEPSY